MVGKPYMKILDENGLLLCAYQGNIFEASVELPCSSKVFLRRFIYSKWTWDEFDRNDSDFLTLQPIDCFKAIERQYGPFYYGKVKYSPLAMHWLGYVTHAISVNFKLTTREVNCFFPFNEVIEHFYTYQFFSVEMAIERLMEEWGYTPKDFDINERFKKAYRERMIALGIFKPVDSSKK